MATRLMQRFVLSLLAGISLLTATTLCGAEPASDVTINNAVEAYIYGYPLITMEMTRRVMTNSATIEGTRGPMGRFISLKQYPNAEFRDVTAPNADTLYSSAWLDLSKEPYVLTIPDESDRYFLMPMLSGWTDVFAVPGKRTTGTGPQTYAITGPNWKGELPTGMKQLQSPTSIVWILGRTYCTGTPEDYEAVHAIQSKYSIVPLSAYGKAYTPPAGAVDPAVDMKTPVRNQVNALDINAYFDLLAKLLKDNLPTAADAPMVAKLTELGIVAGEKFDASKIDPALAKSLSEVPKLAQAKIMGHFKSAGTEKNGWVFTTGTGRYGTDYLQRALITAIGLGANLPQDAVYPTSEVDSTGKPYDGTQNYVMHFPKGQTPPAKGFWSLTMYDAEYFFVKNPLNRYTLSPRDELKYNADGSLDLYIQNQSPGKDKESNWLPTPAGKFILMMRLYWPQETAPSIIDGTWVPPAVNIVK
ncbi:protein of unknown function DUF1254 [Pirellula staleyi DSM 6068]|uniref:DUF1254 domain-containing protein n=1 Tax=Pirellula staleyi (strain ATCC 27377 / DSM 6068 / ICPB 4128) TaxID=530564 RepID=D2R823_PIRSD|nr:DUF1254 domain-containing protein [Pirellula staleyi]ADB19354.1 protein of unknown function DUF1254 [Pirellula staleyi DSM 6068]